MGDGDTAVETEDVIAEDEGAAVIVAILAQIMVEVEAVKAVFLDGLGVELENGFGHVGDSKGQMVVGQVSK